MISKGNSSAWERSQYHCNSKAAFFLLSIISGNKCAKEKVDNLDSVSNPAILKRDTRTTHSSKYNVVQYLLIVSIFPYLTQCKNTTHSQKAIIKQTTECSLFSPPHVIALPRTVPYLNVVRTLAHMFLTRPPKKHSRISRTIIFMFFTCLGDAIFGSCPSYSPCPGLGLCGGGPGGSLVMSRDISGEKGEEV